MEDNEVLKLGLVAGLTVLMVAPIRIYSSPVRLNPGVNAGERHQRFKKWGKNKSVENLVSSKTPEGKQT